VNWRENKQRPYFPGKSFNTLRWGFFWPSEGDALLVFRP